MCKGPVRDQSTAHVGVIYSTSWEHSEGRIWRTGDWGQGASGFDGDFGVSRYDPGAGTLSGVSGTGMGKARALLGWVDIDLFYGTAA
ncbi:MAG: hypothetical protein IT167_19650 [Bryobacterales bacterium]|nr:hypothetical protein [Bryobacterales bacterium]